MHSVAICQYNFYFSWRMMCEPNLKILFVCIGNTCRSPMAESILRDLVEKHKLNWEVDSAGLRSWNVGYYPEERCIKVLSENGLTSNHLGRELHEDDYNQFDYIFGMDESNITELINRKPQQCKAKIGLLGSFIGWDDNESIADPYFEHGDGGFRRCFAQIYTGCKNFVQHELDNK